jgi:hypothetical protein
MNLFQLAAAAGLLGLVGGVAVVNFIPAPRASEIGTIMAGCGVARKTIALNLASIPLPAGMPARSPAGLIRPAARSWNRWACASLFTYLVAIQMGFLCGWMTTTTPAAAFSLVLPIR